MQIVGLKLIFLIGLHINHAFAGDNNPLAFRLDKFKEPQVTPNEGVFKVKSTGKQKPLYNMDAGETVKNQSETKSAADFNDLEDMLMNDQEAKKQVVDAAPDRTFVPKSDNVINNTKIVKHQVIEQAKVIAVENSKDPHTIRRRSIGPGSYKDDWDYDELLDDNDLYYYIDEDDDRFPQDRKFDPEDSLIVKYKGKEYIINFDDEAPSKASPSSLTRSQSMRKNREKAKLLRDQKKKERNDGQTAGGGGYPRRLGPNKELEPFIVGGVSVDWRTLENGGGGGRRKRKRKIHPNSNGDFNTPPPLPTIPVQLDIQDLTTTSQPETAKVIQ